MNESPPLYQRPFVADRFYPVPHAWLRDVHSAQEHDARELILWAHVPGTAEVEFPPDRAIAFWVRSNDDGLPNLMSHPTFGGYLRRMLGEAGTEGSLDAPLIQQMEARPGWFVLVSWSQLCAAGLCYKPRAYIEKRWPARLNTHDWAGRAILLAFCAMAAERTLPGADEVAPVAGTIHQVRSRIQRLMPQFAHGNRVANSLLQLEQVNLVTLVKENKHNRSYMLRLAGFDQTPIAPDAQIAELCGLHPEADAHWIDLIQEFLDAQWRPAAACLEIWRQISAYRDQVTTVDDVEAVIALLQDRRERRVTGVRRIMGDYLRTRLDTAHWAEGHVFELNVVSGANTHVDEVRMPALYGAGVHLRATQLVLRFAHPVHLTRQAAAKLLSGSELTVVQEQGRGERAQYDLCKALRVTKTDIGMGKIVDCNSLHGLVDYARPFTVQLHTSRLADGSIKAQPITVAGHFRVKVTHR